MSISDATRLQTACILCECNCGIEVELDGRRLDRIRGDGRVEFGASPRAGLMLVKAAKARAALEGRDHALPDDVQDLAPAVLAHRLLLVPAAADVERLDVVRDALDRVPAL